MLDAHIRCDPAADCRADSSSRLIRLSSWSHDWLKRNGLPCPLRAPSGWRALPVVWLLRRRRALAILSFGADAARVVRCSLSVSTCPRLSAILSDSNQPQMNADARLIHGWQKQKRSRAGGAARSEAWSGGRAGFVSPPLAARMSTQLCRGFPCPCCHRYRLYKHIYTVQPKFPPWMLELSIRLVMRQDTQEEASKSGLALSRE